MVGWGAFSICFLEVLVMISNDGDVTVEWWVVPVVMIDQSMNRLPANLSLFPAQAQAQASEE